MVSKLYSVTPGPCQYIILPVLHLYEQKQRSVKVDMELSQGGSKAKYGGRGGTVIHSGWLGAT